MLKRVLVCAVTVAFMLGLGALDRVDLAKAASVTSTLTSSTLVVNAQPINSSTCTGYLSMTNYRSSVYDVLYTTVANGAATAITMACYGQTENPPNISNIELSEIVSTSAAGDNTTVLPSWTRAITANTPKKFSITVSNIVWPQLNCCFVGAGANTNDVISVYWRLATP